MQTNFLVIGSGIAGLTVAWKLSQKGKVILVSKSSLPNSNSSWAQGGLAAVLGDYDNFEKHIEDTMKAGHYKNKRETVELVVRRAPTVIKQLLEIGVPFSDIQGREGGHSENRISHVGDYTGKAIIDSLIWVVKNSNNIEIQENNFVFDLITKDGSCHGAITENGTIFAGQTILATGGLGQIFDKTTNPEVATGDGLAMAIRAGAKTRDLKYIQFHPTALDIGESPLFLISEAVRGEGAKLINNKGEHFMQDKHELGDLAPRDIVTAEIRKEHGKGNKTFLDCRMFKAEFFKKRFPQISEKLAEENIDNTKNLIPITPAAHYSCGGVETSLKGQTSVKNLYACGEVAWTGLHGANRLASNSLLEGFVFAEIIAEAAKVLPAKTIQIERPVITKIEAEEKNKELCKQAINLI